MNYLYILLSFIAGSVITLISVTVGAYFVFRTRYAIQDISFLQKPTKKSEPTSYVSDLFPDAEEETDEMSEAAKAIREQKGDTADVMSMLRGRK